jgi:hypothetical protein
MLVEDTSLVCHGIIKNIDIIKVQSLESFKCDNVEVEVVKKLKDYEENLLNKEISDNLFNYGKGVVWVFKGREQNVKSLRDFNQLLSSVCNKVYYKTPIMNNELFNKQKLSSAISTARKNYLHRLLNNYLEEDFGFPKDKFPPEKTIYFSLLKITKRLF